MVRMLLAAGAVGCATVAPEVERDPGATDPWQPPGATPATGEPTPMSGFSFVDDHVAGLPQPGARTSLDEDLRFLTSQDITLLISLTLSPTSPEAVAEHGLDLLHLPIADFHPPELDQQLVLIEALRERRALGERVGVHCTAGLGRTGTMLASWFVAEGLEPQQAIDHVRALRPGSIETAEQEEAVFLLAEALK